jgi:hypothetical protein
MKDFTLNTYRTLLISCKKAGYSFYTFENFIKKTYLQEKFIILRHDVDKNPQNSLKTAIIENEFGIQASYYFRIKKCSFNKELMVIIAYLGHEIGYHYENMDTCSGNYNMAWNDFRNNLDEFRKIYPVKTICMHGSPLSPYDNKSLWQKYDYKELGIVGEPYMNIDFSQIAYLTDTGRRWNASASTIRDKVKTPFHFKIKTTSDFITHIENQKLPDKLMITIHPQRWTNNYIYWIIELISQNIKNIIKRSLIKNYIK